MFSFGLSARQTSKMAFLFTGDKELVKGAALIGPPKKRDHTMTGYGQVLIHLHQDWSLQFHAHLFFNFDRHTLSVLLSGSSDILRSALLPAGLPST